jgi:hypothetical protein
MSLYLLLSSAHNASLFSQRLASPQPAIDLLQRNHEANAYEGKSRPNRNKKEET